MGFKKVKPKIRDHSKKWVRFNRSGGATLSKSAEEEWFADVSNIIPLVDVDNNLVGIVPETSSSNDGDLRKLSRSESTGYAMFSTGSICNEFGFSAQSIEDVYIFDLEYNSKIGCPVFDITELVEEYGNGS